MIKITVEEIEILVTARVEDNLRQNMPKIKQMVEKIRQQFEKTDTTGLEKNVKQSINQASSAIKQIAPKLKENFSNVIDDKSKQKIIELEKEISKLEKQINGKQLKLDITNNALDAMRENTKQRNIAEMPDAGAKRINNATLLDLSNNDTFNSMVAESDKLASSIDKDNIMLEATKSKLQELRSNAEQVTQSQSKWGLIVSMFKQGIESAKQSLSGMVSKMQSAFSKVHGALSKVKDKIKNTFGGNSIKGGIKQILRYAGALLSIRSVYMMLRQSANAWLSSQNSQAKQLQANLQYMQYAMGSALSPIIEYLINLMYQLMKAVQSVAYALTRVNIFAKASASSYSSMANSAKQTAKETKKLAGIDEITNIGGDDSNSDSGSGNVAPNIDLSTLDGQMSPLAQKIYDFFKPLKDSWDTYGGQVVSALKNAIDGIGSAFSAMWSSVEQLFTNGTIYSILSNILNTIGEIGKAWANAWNNDNNGTEIIQGIANIINDITGAILNLVSSTGFQAFLDGVLSAISGIVQFMEPVIAGFTEIAEKIIEIVMSTIGDVLKTVGDALQVIAQNETVVEILKALGSAIAIVVAGIVGWNVAQAILNGLMGLFTVLTSPITLIIAGIVAAITAIILVIKNWGSISEWFGNLWNKVKDKISNAWNAIKTKITDTINKIKTGITTKFNAIKTGITNIVTKIKNGLVTGFTNAKNKVVSVFTTLKTKVGSIFTAIWNVVKKPINAILGGVEKMANGVISGINLLIKALNKIHFDIPDWVPALGGKSFGFNIGELSKVSLPRLATGNVATKETLAIFGEYAGASTNPEITAPQNIIYETTKQAIIDSSTTNNNSSSMPREIVIKFGSYRVALEVEELIRKARRQNGTATVTI